MRQAVLVLAVVFTASVGSRGSQGAPGSPADGRADTVLAAARKALGGEAKQASVKTLTATGQTRQVRGDNLVPIVFTIDCELPGKYVRTDEVPAQETGPNTVGFVDDVLILRPVPPMPLAPAARATRLGGAKQDFARLMLGLFAQSYPAFPLTFGYAGQAESPQGKADVLDMKGPANFAGRLFVYSDTHLPTMVTWQAGPAENRLFFSDYRDVNGLQFPFRLRRAVGADTVEETTFDRFRLNGKIDPKRFATE